MELSIAKLRYGGYFSILLEPWDRSGKAQLTVIQKTYVEGVSTTRVGDLVKDIGYKGISYCKTSRISQGLNKSDNSVTLPATTCNEALREIQFTRITAT